MMFKIYPKIAEGDVLTQEVKLAIRKYRGIEIYLHSGGVQRLESILLQIDRQLSLQLLDEITIHYPLEDMNLETSCKCLTTDFMYKARNIARTYNLRINTLFHTEAAKSVVERHLLPSIHACLEIIEGYDVKLLLENGVNLLKTFAGATACSMLRHPQVGLCIDTTHYRIVADLYKEEPSILLKELIGDAEQYIHQIHFASHLGDGFRDRATHGRKHESQLHVQQELHHLFQAGVPKDVIFVTEVSEDDYLNRPDMLQEFRWLECELQEYKLP